MKHEATAEWDLRSLLTETWVICVHLCTYLQHSYHRDVANVVVRAAEHTNSLYTTELVTQHTQTEQNRE